MQLKNHQISYSFYKKFRIVRKQLIEKVSDNLTPVQKELLAQRIFDRIFFIYFLRNLGFIETIKGHSSASHSFSFHILNNGKFFENFYELIKTFNNSDQRTININGYTIKCPLLNEKLFQLSEFEEANLKVNLSRAEIKKIFEFLDQYRWNTKEESKGETFSRRVLTPEIFGHIFERSLLGQGTRKLKGVFYTPKEIVDYICEKTILKHFLINTNSTENNLLKIIHKSDPVKDLDLLRNLLNNVNKIKILDPACGSGAFLIKAAELLFNLKSLLYSKLNIQKEDYEIKLEIISYNLYGIDLDQKAIDITKIRLELWLISSTNPSRMINPLAEVKYNLLVGNFLTKWKNSEEKLLEFSGFDIIVGNPPYVFTRGMKLNANEKKFYIEKYLSEFRSLTSGKAKQSGKINLYSLLIIHSIDLVKKNGSIGFIAPNTLLRTITNDILRQFIVHKTYIEEIVDLEAGIFKGVTASTIIMILRKELNYEKKSTTIKYNVKNLLKDEFNSHQIKQSKFKNNVICCFNIHVNPEFQTIFKSMVKETFKLGDVSKEVIEGLVTRKKDNLFIKNPNHPLAKKLLRGKDIDKYVINWKPGQYIIFDPNKLHRSRPVYVHEAPEKLIIQRIGGGKYPLRVAYDDEQFYIFASINAIILKDNPKIEGIRYSYKYILAILNSKLMNSYYLLNYSNRSSLTVNISKTFLEALPIKKVSEETQEVFTKIVDFVLFLKKNFNNEKDLIDFFDKVILESMIFELYFPEHFLDDIINIIFTKVQPIDFTKEGFKNLRVIKENYQSLIQSTKLKEKVIKINSNPMTMKIHELFISHKKNTKTL